MSEKTIKMNFEKLDLIKKSLLQDNGYIDNPNLKIDDFFDTSTTLTALINAQQACGEQELLRNEVYMLVNETCDDVNKYGVTFEELDVY